MNDLPVEKCTWSANFFCKFISLFNDESQYITWGLVLIGWAIAIYIALWQTKKNRTDYVKGTQNQWIGEFRDKLTSLEDEALSFWTGGDTQNSHMSLQRMGRNIKGLTTIAREIEYAGGVKYDNKLFKDLRQSITSDNDLHKRPLSPTCYQVDRIRNACASLRRVYSRSIVKM
ncbi:hypothetical protein GBN23_02915 [Plesiomonas shigelloides]|uniref:hypothetical protein n=1 Tax=Plesiomonas shigelloides TaxID=703 RepID=UPI001262A81D|nr:hypothetical protein [Plesiomonas shigelloides]KAB7684441.1 hypothetical protein GBN23_02915 [Plesiomonas shigelloides]